MSKLTRFRDEKRRMNREVVKQTRRMWVKGRIKKKWKGLKGGCYHTPPSTPPLAIMNLQTMTRFRYFHFCINMLKWQVLIYWFKQKSPTTFLIWQPTKTCKKVFAIFEVLFPEMCSWFFFFKSKLLLSCWMLTKFQPTVLL